MKEREETKLKLWLNSCIVGNRRVTMKRAYVIGDKYDKAKAAKQIMEAIEDIECIGLKDVLDRNRPYNSQPWTNDGERGQMVVQGLTMRDIRDCLILAFYSSAPVQETTPQSVEDLPLAEMSLEAISQNLACWLERYMGIFPNVPERFK